jgi:hypothetical protein
MRRPLSALAAADEPVSVHTFGFGADHDSRLLQAVAEAGNGMYYFIQVITGCSYLAEVAFGEVCLH